MLPEQAFKKTMAREIDVTRLDFIPGYNKTSMGIRIKPPPAPIKVPKPPIINPKPSNSIADGVMLQLAQIKNHVHSLLALFNK